MAELGPVSIYLVRIRLRVLPDTMPKYHAYMPTTYSLYIYFVLRIHGVIMKINLLLKTFQVLFVGG